VVCLPITVGNPASKVSLFHAQPLPISSPARWRSENAVLCVAIRRDCGVRLISQFGRDGGVIHVGCVL